MWKKDVRSYILNIEGSFPGGNAIKSMPTWKYAKLRNDIEKRLKFYFETHGRPVLKNQALAFIQFERTYTNKPQDHENFTLTGKPWFDMLQKLGVVEDDDQDHVIRRYVQKKGKPKVRITIKRWEETDPPSGYELVK